MGILTRFRHINKMNPHAFRTNSYYELNVERCGHTIGLRGDRFEVGTKRDERQARAKSMNPFRGSVRMSLARNLSPTSRP